MPVVLLNPPAQGRAGLIHVVCRTRHGQRPEKTVDIIVHIHSFSIDERTGVSGPDTAPGNIASGKSHPAETPLFLCGPGCIAERTGRKAGERIAFFSYTPVSDRIRTFVALLSHARPASRSPDIRHNGCYVSKHTIRTRPLRHFLPENRVLPFFLFSSGSPIPGCRILKDKKIIVNRPGKQIFHPSRKNPVSTAPKTSAVKFFVSQRLFLFREASVFRSFSPENAPFPSDNKPFSSFGNAGLDCFGREGKRFFHEHRAAFQIPSASLAQFSRNPDTRQDHERYFFRFAGFRNPPRFACQAVRTGFDGTAWRLSGFPAIFCARTRPAFPPDVGMV